MRFMTLVAVSLFFLAPSLALAQGKRVKKRAPVFQKVQEPVPATSTEIGPPIDRRPSRMLNLDEALDLALKNNRDLQAARERLKVSHADIERAWSVLLPRLNATGRYSLNEPEITFPRIGNFSDPKTLACLTNPTPDCPVQAIVPRHQLEASVTATLPLIAPAAYPALRGAKHAYEGQKKQLAATEAQLLQSVASAFYASAGADELVQARSHAIDVARQTLDNARARLEAGVVNRVEVTRAELALIQVQQRLLESEDSRGSAYRVLATLLLLRDPFKVAPPENSAVEGRSDGELVGQAIMQRPEIPALEASIAAFESQVLSMKLRWLPTVSGFGNMRFTNASGFAGGRQGNCVTDPMTMKETCEQLPRYDFYSLGLQLDWQIFDGTERDAQRHAFAAQAKEARLKLRQLKDTIADDVQNARRQAMTKREGLKTAQRSVQLARETLDLVRIQHDAGTATQLDLLTAQDQLIVSEVGLAQARFDLALSDIQLRRLVGEMPGTRP